MHFLLSLFTSLYRESFPPSPADVVVPLDQAHLYSHSGRTRARAKTKSTANGSENDDGTALLDRNDGVGSSADDGKDREGDGEEEGGGDEEDRRGESYSIEGLRMEIRRGEKGEGWGEYELKAKVINKAIQDIGMGRYNWQLFVLCGFGWMADNLWLQGVSLTLPSLTATFSVPEKRVRYTTSILFLGLCLGSFTWGISSDVLGRRVAFNSTLVIAATFGILASFAPSWPWTCAAYAAMGFGVGGNLPVDGALFLEFLPDADARLLTLLSVWWPVGQLVSSLLAWGFIANMDADVGWRVFMATIGALTLVMFALRFWGFNMLESPKFLLSCGRDHEAVEVVQAVAWRNGGRTWLTEEVLEAVAGDGYSAGSATREVYEGGGGDEEDGDGDGDVGVETGEEMMQPLRSYGSGTRRHGGSRRRVTPRGGSGGGFGASYVIRGKLASFSAARLRPLFRTRKLGLATALIWFTWATIGMGYPLFNAFLPQYFSHGGASSSSSVSASSSPASNITGAFFSSTRLSARQEEPPAATITPTTYRNYAITSVLGVPGSLLAAYSVDHPSPFLGRRGTLAISTLTSAIFLFLFVLFGTTPSRQLFFSCVEAFVQNIMYGVLYAFTPEIFPAPVRGAGSGVASFLNRLTGLAAPIVAANVPGDGTTVPVYLSAGLILGGFLGVVGVPIETRGRDRL